MAVTNVTDLKMQMGVNYTHTTDNSGDWASVANSTYFYDIATKIVYYKNSSGNVVGLFDSGSNIYTANGTLTGTRAVTMDGFNLSFSGGKTSFGANVYFGDGDAPLQVNATDSTSLLRGYTSTNVLGIALKAITTTGGQVLIANTSGTGVISLNGVGDSYFNAVGNFGIGVASPTTKLHIISTTGIDPLRIENSSGFLAKFTDASTFEIGGGGAGQRVYIKGAGATSGTTALMVHNSASSPIFELRDDVAIGMFGATPVVRATTGGASSTFTANTSGIADNTATFDGYTIGQIVKALRNIGILQ